MDVFIFAMKLELEGKAYYEKLAAETVVEGLTAIFSGLAADELKHYKTFKEMQEGMFGIMADSRMLEQAKSVFPGLQDRKVVDGLKEDLDAYRHAMKIEEDSIRLYEDMAGKEQNHEIVRLLLQIADEEKKHLNIIDNLYNLVLKPRYLLKWGEFVKRPKQ